MGRSKHSPYCVYSKHDSKTAIGPLHKSRLRRRVHRSAKRRSSFLRVWRKQLNGVPRRPVPHGRFCHCRNCWNSCSFSASIGADVSVGGGVFNFSELRERGEIDAPVVSDRCALEALW